MHQSNGNHRGTANNRVLIGGAGAAGLQLSIVNTTGGERSSGNMTAAAFNSNLKVQKNLLKLKEMAMQNQNQSHYYQSTNLVNSSMMLPPHSLEDLNSSFIGGADSNANNYSSQLRIKNGKTQNSNRQSKATPISSVHMAKDIYRKGNAVSQSSTRTNNYQNASSVYRRPIETRQNILIANGGGVSQGVAGSQSQKRSSTYVRYAQRLGSSSQNRTLNLYLQDSEATSGSSVPYQQAISTLGNQKTIGGGALALNSQSILTKDESIEKYIPSDHPPPNLHTKVPVSHL